MLKKLLNCSYKLCLTDYHLQQELCHLEKVFIRNNFARWVVEQIMKNGHNQQANPNTCTSLTRKVSTIGPNLDLLCIRQLDPAPF